MNYSGKFVLRLEPQLHQQLKQEAIKQGLSLNQICVDLIMRSLGSTLKSDPVVTLAKKYFKDDLLGVILFGSQARGEQRASSDKDYLIVLKPEVTINRKLIKEWDKKSNLPDVYSIHFSHLPSDSPGSLWLEVALDGVILFDNDSQIKTSIEKIKSIITSGKVRRHTSYGHPYWILEEN